MILTPYNPKLNIIQDKYILYDQTNYLDFPFFVHIGSVQFFCNYSRSQAEAV